MEEDLQTFPGLGALLERDRAANEYFYSLPTGIQSALLRQGEIASFAELQSHVADEQG